jgi:competence protein ComEC
LRSIAAALLLGDGASIPPEIRRRYARAGVSHVLAISGLHIGLVAAATYAAARWLLGRSERALLTLNVPKLATAATLPPVVAYAAVAGTNAATLRATVMAALFLSALLFDRSRHWPATLAVAAAVVCSISPGAAFEASFQLSFAAVIAIVAGGNRLLEAYDNWAEQHLWRLSAPRCATLGRWIVASQGMTLLAMLATAPLTLHHFQQLSAVGAISNLVIVPIVGMGAVAFGLVAVWVTPVLPGAGGVLFGICCRLLAAGDELTGLFAGLPAADLHLPSPSAAEIATYYALLATPWIRKRRLRTAVAGITILAAAVQVASWYVERAGGDELRVTFLSVGQGDSTVVELPGGRVILVDGGGLSTTFDVGERVIAPFLLRRKILTVDSVVLTHPDFDHYGGLSYIIDRFGVKEVWTNGSRGGGSRYHRFQRACRGGAKQVLARRGVRRLAGGVEIAVLHPPRAGTDDSNDASVVVRLAYAGVGILLTGDLERDGERELVGRGGDLHSTILKVPHHGSRTSSTALLLEAVAPRLAIVSVGHRNRYRMPHPDVVERYRSRSIAVLRTDRDGAVEIRVAPSGAFQVAGGHRRRSRVTFPPSEAEARPPLSDFRLTGREMAT